MYTLRKYYGDFFLLLVLDLEFFSANLGYTFTRSVKRAGGQVDQDNDEGYEDFCEFTFPLLRKA
jgi:hypothetical protein